MIPESNFPIIGIDGTELARVETGGREGLVGRLEVGTLPRLTYGRYGEAHGPKLPYFMVSIYHRPCRRMLLIGRLYCGYVGLMANLLSFKLTIWIYKPSPEIS